MLVYVEQVTERVQYAFDFVFKQHRLEYAFTNDRMLFEEFKGLKFNYSTQEFIDVPSMIPSELLFEEHIAPRLQLEKSMWSGVECIAINGKTDPFAAVFYMLSRYEEYTCQQKDIHDRFEAKSSISFRFGWLEIPIAEYWVEAIFRTFLPKEIHLLSKQEVQVIPSFDIDHTYAYKWKDGWRKWASTVKDLMRNRKESIRMRHAVQKGVMRDPYDTFDRIREVASRFPDTRVFWHLGDIAEFDRNISWRDPRHQRLIRQLAAETHVQLHPGYASNYSDTRLAGEQQRLHQITGKKPEESRQHFLKLTLPHTYRRLKILGFTTDYTMGYADQPGFRLGTARAVPFFDLERNEICSYTLVPFFYMDGTMREYLNLSVAESKQRIVAMAGEIKRFGGVACFIWHNETIGESGKWKGWSQLLDYTLELFAHGGDTSISTTV